MMTEQHASPETGTGVPRIAADAVSIEPPRPGDICPNCGRGELDYNGLFELECPACGFRGARDADCGCSFRSDPV